MEDYGLKIARARMPSRPKRRPSTVSRLEQMHPDAAESTVVRTYLDWLVELPWSYATEDNLDIKEARILNEDHYDLEKAKKRILEYLASKAQEGHEGADPLLCGAARRWKDVPGQIDRPGPGEKVHEDFPGGHAG